VSAKKEKLPSRPLASVHPGSRVDLSGSFACGARHWTPVSLPENGLP